METWKKTLSSPIVSPIVGAAGGRPEFGWVVIAYALALWGSALLVVSTSDWLMPGLVGLVVATAYLATGVALLRRSTLALRLAVTAGAGHLSLAIACVALLTTR